MRRLDGITNSYRFASGGALELEEPTVVSSTCDPYELGPAMLSMLSVSDIVGVINGGPD